MVLILLARSLGFPIPRVCLWLLWGGWHMRRWPILDEFRLVAECTLRCLETLSQRYCAIFSEKLDQWVAVSTMNRLYRLETIELHTSTYFRM